MPLELAAMTSSLQPPPPATTTSSRRPRATQPPAVHGHRRIKALRPASIQLPSASSPTPHPATTTGFPPQARRRDLDAGHPRAPSDLELGTTPRSTLLALIRSSQPRDGRCCLE